MIKGLSGDVTVNVIASIIASLVLLAAGFLWGKYKERRKYGRNLEDYDFYPFTINRENFPEFNLKDFRLGMHYFLKNNDYTAARQLIFIGEQNNVRAQLEPSEQKVYARLFEKYDGKTIADDKWNIGARRFKCTTIPILRKDFGIVGAICINIDANYLTEEVMQSKERIEAWFKNFCRTDMQLDENILSKDEYAKAMKGQRHFKDEAF